MYEVKYLPSLAPRLISALIPHAERVALP